MLITQIASHHKSTVAIISQGQQFTFEELLNRSKAIAAGLLGDSHDLHEARVAFMVSPGFDYVATLLGIWQAGGVAVPLCLTHPPASLQYTLTDSLTSIVVTTSEYQTILQPICYQNGISLTLVNEITNAMTPLPIITLQRRAMILYTSGTTNLPKGVVTTHKNLYAQITTLVTAWQWTNRDHTLCVLPLHHVHGIVNVVLCSLWGGAVCEFLPAFDAAQVFNRFKRGQVNVFMAVPTIYFKLIAYWETLEKGTQEEISKALKKFRLMVSGSAALPVSVMEKWKGISNHTLLERYGMTEIGMAISNPYEGERRAGHVGRALPGVSVRLCDARDQVITGEPGEIQVKGDNVFHEYWNRPDETKKSFTTDGWFKTGDVAVMDNGYYRIMGRNSVDIIKSGGYKISALEIEEVLRQHELIQDCCVVGLENEEWGEIVAAALVARPSINTEVLSQWLKERLPAYRVPRKYLFIEELPRNAMGKVTKHDVKKLFES